MLNAGNADGGRDRNVAVPNLAGADFQPYALRPAPVLKGGGFHFHFDSDEAASRHATMFAVDLESATFGLSRLGLPEIAAFPLML